MKPSTFISRRKAWRRIQLPPFRASSVVPLQKVQTKAGRLAREKAEGQSPIAEAFE